MAAQSKTTAVHFSLIIFVMLSVILGVVAVLFFNDYRGQQAQVEQNADKLRTAEGAVRKQGEEIDNLKKIIGIEAGEVGTGTGEDGTVLAQAKQAISTLGTNPAAPDFLTALRDLRNELNNKNTELAQREAAMADLQTQLTALNSQYQAREKAHDDKRQMTEQDLASEQTKFNETMAAKDQELDSLRAQAEEVTVALAQTKEQTGAQIAALEEENGRLLENMRMLQAERDKVVGQSFEVADGQIVSVDQVGRVVWINLGEADGLKPRTNFSIYTKSNRGIGREAPDGGRPEDIKGSIEVTRILGSKMAEARILHEDGSRPIAPGDPIYTPLWGAGRSDQFAFAGDLDIDGDGSYVGDRERLHEIIKSNGSRISSELLTTGERKGGTIDQNTRFLVIGDAPEVSDAPAGSQRQQELITYENEVAKMRREAESSGVRIINLSSFLDFIGFVPQQQRFVPGESTNWSMRAGAPERTNRTSGGSTSGVFDTDRSRPNPASSTIQRFGNN